MSYYRLGSVDFAYYSEIFDVVLVKNDNTQADFTVFPNPIENGHFSMQTNFVPAEEFSLTNYYNMGPVEAHYGINYWLTLFESVQLQPGNYMLKLETPDGIIVKRILVK